MTERKVQTQSSTQRRAAMMAAAICLAVQAASAEPFTIAVLPDTQFYSKDTPGTFKAQAQWIVDNRVSRNIVFVTHLGDITDAGYDMAQWMNAEAAMRLLDGVLPFGVAPGNHDLYLNPAEDSPNREFVTRFGPDSRYFKGKSWYGGASAGGFSSYQKIVAGGHELIVLQLDDNAKDDEIAWAQSVIGKHPGIATILVTHDYMDVAGRRKTPYLREAGRNSGEQIWDKLVRRNAQIFMVLCGHAHGQRYQVSRNDAGLDVHEML
ncbi:MAG: metallophosphoesterase, partial [Phycisphaerae bacterium]|nr:metallophosphoesterase [Phycisphaerae bacterium]